MKEKDFAKLREFNFHIISLLAQKDKATELSSTYNKLPETKETFDSTTDEASFESIKDPQSPPKSTFKNVFLKGPQADAFIDRFGRDNIVNNPFFKAISIGAYNAASRYFSGADRFLPNDKKKSARAYGSTAACNESSVSFK